MGSTTAARPTFSESVSTIPRTRARQTLAGRGPVSHLEEPPGGDLVRLACGALFARGSRRDLQYPEFQGFFGAWRWLEIQTPDGNVRIRNASRIPYFGLYRPTPVRRIAVWLPDLGWSFLHACRPSGQIRAARRVRPAVPAREFTGTLRGESHRPSALKYRISKIPLLTPPRRSLL